MTYAVANSTLTGAAVMPSENSEVSPVLSLVAVAVIQPFAGRPPGTSRLMVALPLESVVTASAPTASGPVQSRMDRRARLVKNWIRKLSFGRLFKVAWIEPVFPLTAETITG